MPMQKKLKILFLGESGVGKTSLIFKLISGDVPEEWRLMSGFSEIPHYDITLHSTEYQLWIYDTWKLDELDSRTLLYAGTDVFVLCFDISDRYSLESLSTRFIPELKGLMPSTPILLVGNKADLRSSDLSSDQHGLVQFEEPYLLARRLGGYYVECSAISCGLSAVQVMDACVHLWKAYNNTVTALITQQGKLRFLSGKMVVQRTNRHPKIFPPLPPYLRLPEPLPSIQVPESTYAVDLLRLLDAQVCTDIEFVFGEEKMPIGAHKMLLVSSSYSFEQMLMMEDKTCCDGRSALLFNVLKCSCETNSANDNRPSTLYACKTKVQTTLCREACSFLLKILYSDGSNHLFENASEKDKTAIVRFLNDYEIRNQTSCKEVTNGSPGINSLALKMKNLFLNKPLFADVTFNIDGQLVFAHKALLIARSEVMARMLLGDFVESFSTQVNIEDASLSSFLAMLEYLYTDSLPTDVTEDAVELMVLADRFGLPRLVAMCEQLIANSAGDCLGPLKLIQTGSDAANLLNIAKACNADQLSKWCLQFIATNYSVFEGNALELVDCKSRKYIEEHRWPSSMYFEELEMFKKRTNRQSQH